MRRLSCALLAALVVLLLLAGDTRQAQLQITVGDRRFVVASVSSFSPAITMSANTMSANTSAVANLSANARVAGVSNGTHITTLSDSAPGARRVFVLTFSDKRDNLYLHALASSVAHFNGGAPLYVLGLSGRRSPRASEAGRWSIERKSISGTDPGKLKKLWFLGALLERASPLGMREDDLLLFVDAFDVLVQRRLDALPEAFSAFVRASSREAGATADEAALDPEAVAVLCEHNCWPWPQPELEGSAAGTRRPRGVSMGYMRNATFDVLAASELASTLERRRLRRRLVRSEGMCAALRARARPGTWLHPNSGVYLSTLRGTRALLERLRQLVMLGHFEDQGMMGLALMQHPRGSIRIDSNASLFSSQYGYNAGWWARPACFDDYFDGDGEPPPQLASGAAPFVMHFNGPAGRHRLGWCVAAFLNHCGRRRQYYIDVDGGGSRVELPHYCGADRTDEGLAPPAWAAARSAAPPAGRLPVAPTRERCSSTAQPRLRCINDRCFTFRG